jgi:hypothetical protein
MQKPIRYHHLDALRAIMMLLGIVIHSALSYCVYDHKLVWVVSDEFSEHVAFDALADFIHLFRMQIFFIVAGFFGAMLYFKRGAKAMLINRIRRVLLPLILAFIIIIPISIYAFKYSMNAVQLALGQATTINYQFSNIVTIENLSLIHLWFLYYLIFFYFVAFLFTRIITNYYEPMIGQIRNRFKSLFLTNKIIILNIILTYFALLTTNKYVIEASLELKPDFTTFYTYGIFFAFGWLLFHQRAYLDQFKLRYKVFLFLGLSLCLVRWVLPLFIEGQHYFIVFIKMILCATIIWFLVYGIIGLFISKFEKQSWLMKYLSDASYWIYLTHLPLTAFLPGICVFWDIPIFFKFLFVVLSTFAITMITYHFFVRNTFIGKFLNGKKYSTYKEV